MARGHPDVIFHIAVSRQRLPGRASHDEAIAEDKTDGQRGRCSEARKINPLMPRNETLVLENKRLLYEFLCSSKAGYKEVSNRGAGSNEAGNSGAGNNEAVAAAQG